MAEAAKGVGKPKVGGKFELLDQDGRTFTDEDIKGGYTLVSVSIACLYVRTLLINSCIGGLFWLLPLPRYLP